MEVAASEICVPDGPSCGQESAVGCCAYNCCQLLFEYRTGVQYSETYFLHPVFQKNLVPWHLHDHFGRMACFLHLGSIR